MRLCKNSGETIFPTRDGQQTEEKDASIRLTHTQLGNPQQNAYIERYNRTVRYDWLSHYLFGSIDEVQNYGIEWMWTYNHERPNMALGGITPKQKLALLTNSASDIC